MTAHRIRAPAAPEAARPEVQTASPKGVAVPGADNGVGAPSEHVSTDDAQDAFDSQESWDANNTRLDSAIAVFRNRSTALQATWK